MNRSLKLALFWLGMFVVFLPVSYVTSCIGIEAFLMTHRQTIDPKAVPDRYPVLLITHGYTEKPGDMVPIVLQRKLKSGDVASVVLYPNLQNFTNHHPDYSYLVPAAEVQELNSAMQTDLEHGEQVFAGIEVTQLAGNRQNIYLDASLYDDDTNESWYEATDRQFTPQSYHSHNDLGAGMAGGIAALLPGIVLALLIATLVTWLRARKLRKAAAPSSQ